MTDATKNPPGFLFQLTCDCGNGKTIAVSGNWSADVSLDKINTDIDLVNTAFDRQRAKHEAPLIADRIDGTREQLASQEADLALLKAQHPNLNEKSPIRATINKAEQQIASLRVAIVKGEITLAETQARAA